jgi:hypothetical protein
MSTPRTTAWGTILATSIAPEPCAVPISSTYFTSSSQGLISSAISHKSFIQGGNDRRGLGFPFFRVPLFRVRQMQIWIRWDNEVGRDGKNKTSRKASRRSMIAALEYLKGPRRWRGAKIVVLRKPGKPDYSIPGAYRPISLLNILGKLLEAVMARRLLYLAEKHGLLPDTQFRGRPGRTTE